MRRSAVRRDSSAAGSPTIRLASALTPPIVPCRPRIASAPGAHGTLQAMVRTVITFGTFDVFHVGHLRIIERAASYGDRLVVGVSADALNRVKKAREPVFSEGERLAIVAALKPVDEVFVEESL